MFASSAASVEQLLHQGVVYHKIGDLDKAEAIYKQIISVDNDNFNALHFLGLLEGARSDYSKSINTLQKAIKLNPNYAEVRSNLGIIFRRAGMKKKAVSEFENAIKLDPNYSIAHKQLEELRREMSNQYFSQHGQDEYIYENFFVDKKDGFFVDIGAFDGVDCSNTIFFEKSLGWDGLCIEPSPQQFEKLIQTRSCRCVDVCVSNFEGEADFLNIVKGPEMVSGLLNSYQASRLEKVNQHKNKQKEILSLKVMRVSRLFAEEGINHIDYCSIDVEGAEMDIVQDIDFDAVFIDVLSIENNYKHDDMKQYMLSRGYDFIASVGADEIFKKKAL